MDRYLELAGRRIKAADALIYALNNDCFLSLFFNNVIYTSYTNDKANGELYFPFIQDTEALKNTISLKKELAENKNIYIGFQGEISDERSSVDLRNESSFTINRDYPKAKGEYFGAYFVDPAYNVITGISFYYKFDSGLELEVEKAMMVKTGRLSELEKPVNEIPKVKNSTGKIHIPLVIYKDMERDVQRHINPLVDIKRMTMRDYTGEGITMR